MLMSWRGLCSSVFAMSDAWFSPVKIWVSNSQIRIVSDVHAAAETLTQSWPPEAKGMPKRMAALICCVDFLSGKARAEKVRQCLIEAAEEADILG